MEMEINKEILERIRAYYAQALESAEAEEVGQLITSDEIYSEHNKLYRATNAGIKTAGGTNQKAWMRALDEKDQDAVQLEQLELLKKSATRDKLQRRLIVLGALMLLIAGLILFLRPKNTVDTTAPPPISNPDRPIAEEPLDDGDELIGSTGKITRQTVRQIDFSMETGEAKRTEIQKSILIKSIAGSDLFYSFRGTDLVLELPKQIELQSLKWLQVTARNSTKEYLQINTVLYELNKRLTDRGPLQQIQDATLSQTLKNALDKI